MVLGHQMYPKAQIINSIKAFQIYSHLYLTSLDVIGVTSAGVQFWQITAKRQNSVRLRLGWVSGD